MPADGFASGRSIQPCKRDYRLVFYANRHGLRKRVELACENADRAIDLAISDPAGRTVDIWENGEFLCQIGKGKAQRRGDIVPQRRAPQSLKR
jgi:hypothetical protein